METKISTPALVRSAFTKFALTGLIAIFSVLTVSAHEGTPVNKDKEITVTPVGVENAEIVFNLKHLNANADKIYISLADKDGTKLYAEVINTKNFDKTFKINSEVGTVYLVVTNTRTRTQEKFEISPRSHVVEDVSISNVN